MNMRNTPELRFIADQSIEYGVNMSHLIDEITADLHDDENEDEVEVSEDFAKRVGKISRPYQNTIEILYGCF